MVKIKAPSKKDLTHTVKHKKASILFYSIVIVCGWFAPPLAVLVRFGVGKDFFLNIILTLCGYFPGHFHNFYLQNIRNNKNRARTPKWAIRYGLVHVKDPKKNPKRQWANRYEERNPYNDYEDDASSGSPSQSASWDGRGPEPPPKDDLYSGGPRHKALERLSPWKDVIDAEEVEDGYDYATGASSARNKAHRSGRDEDVEEFYATDGLQDSNAASSAHSGRHHGGGGSKIRNLVTGTSSRQEPDRFDRMERARKRTYEDNSRVGNSGGGGGDEWERREGIGFFGGEQDARAYDEPVGAGRQGQGAGRRRTGDEDALEHQF
ncbi:hypothetical protein BT69DRAFT_1288730 [Atractiella rhizophila]|nr:hypothetical protein BT69DRAFT_1288730 [Atractiella rhizophila]